MMALLATGAILISTNGPLVVETPTAVSGAQEVRARVRLRTDATPQPMATFSVGSLVVSLAATRGQNVVRASLNDQAWEFRLRAYEQILPGWEPNYRAQIEDAMARLPDLENKWLDVRLQLRPGLARVWLDDRLVAEREEAALVPEGTLKIQLAPGVQLALWEIKQWAEAQGFLPLGLAGYANARSLLGRTSVTSNSLPATATIDGVPFEFPGVNAEGNDHLDVGQSLFREANTIGYVPTYMPGFPSRWAGAGARDPARIQLRMPHGHYDNLYLIAAADGDANSVPLVSAVFYRPTAGFTETFVGRVPLATARSAEATPFPVTLTNGKKVNLWLVRIPLDPARTSSCSEFEITKAVYPYRNYPDPISYGFQQGGLPSGVHIYAATLSRSPVVFDWQPDRFGHVWTAPEMAAYTATVTNRSPAAVAGSLTVTTCSYDGSEETRRQQPITVPTGGAVQAKFSLPVKLNGYHDIVATLELDGQSWTEQRSFVRLAPDTRSAKWTEGKGPLFGYWGYYETHGTPRMEEHVRLMTMAGARTTGGFPAGAEKLDLVKKHWGPVTMGNPWFVGRAPWADDPQRDPASVKSFQESIVKAVQDWEENVPPEFKADDLYMFPEPHISTRLTSGNYPEYWGDPPFEHTAEEQQAISEFLETARMAAEGYRAAFPDRKILIPHGDPLFIVPLLRAGLPTNLVDGCGLDVPGFGKLPERQLHEQSIHRLFVLRKEFEKVGLKNPRLQFQEGIFVPTEPGSCTWREQMDNYHRWALLSMAYGVQRFYSGWFTFDCGDYYGAENYGGCGIFRRFPWTDPKPAYAAYATMTDKLNEANFDGWLPTGSLTTFCLRFKHDTRGYIYALWTVRGKRPVTLTLAADAKAGITDSMNNTTEVASADKKITVTTDPSVIYLTGIEIASASVGEPDHSDSVPAPTAKLIANLGDGTWKYTAERNEAYERNH